MALAAAAASQVRPLRRPRSARGLREGSRARHGGVHAMRRARRAPTAAAAGSGQLQRRRRRGEPWLARAALGAALAAGALAVALGTVAWRVARERPWAFCGLALLLALAGATLRRRQEQKARIRIGGAASSLLVLSNGHGEDAIGAALCEALARRAPGVTLYALPLVGEGAAYKKAASAHGTAMGAGMREDTGLEGIEWHWHMRPGHQRVCCALTLGHMLRRPPWL